MQKVIRPYDPAWPGLYVREAEAVRSVTAGRLCALHHMGSTAVPGMIAKPVIDMLGEAGSLKRIDDVSPAMVALGYEARGEYGIAGRRYFSKAPSDPEGVGFHLHIYEIGSPQIARHLRFRDYLIANSQAAQDYAALKRSLAGPDGAIPSDYQARKLAFCTALEEQAAAWVAASA
jgi:GrpB-like predicted nucleotidyltransferase (UPF0157 family)